MMLSDLASPAEAGFANAGNRYPPRVEPLSDCFDWPRADHGSAVSKTMGVRRWANVQGKQAA